MDKLIIQSSTVDNPDNLPQSLGISRKRFNEIIDQIMGIIKRNPNIRSSDLAQQVSINLELTINEVFMLGAILIQPIKVETIISELTSNANIINSFPMAPAGEA